MHKENDNGQVNEGFGIASKASIERAKQFLAEVGEEHSFVLADGKRLRSLYELRDALAYVEDHVFYHHVNEHKNDFSAWIYGVQKDKVLAELLGPEKDKSRIIQILADRILRLEKLKLMLPYMVQEICILSSYRTQQQVS